MATDTDEIAVQYGQSEIGVNATSSIRTTTVPVTRERDINLLVSDGADPFTGYDQTKGTFVVIGRPAEVTTNSSCWLSVSDLTSDNRIHINNNGAGAQAFSKATTDQFNLNFNGSLTAGVVTKLGLSYIENDIAFTKDGASVKPDTSATIPVVTKCHIGSLFNDSRFSNVHIETVLYYGEAISDADLIAKTTL